VSCQNQSSRIYCSNGHACGGANFTNDIYITFPSNGRTGQAYDTITRATFAFNQTIALQASSASHSSRESSKGRQSSSRGSPLSHRQAPSPHRHKAATWKALCEMDSHLSTRQRLLALRRMSTKARSDMASYSDSQSSDHRHGSNF
jgi:hypothetical protein